VKQAADYKKGLELKTNACIFMLFLGGCRQLFLFNNNLRGSSLKGTRSVVIRKHLQIFSPTLLIPGAKLVFPDFF